MSKTSDENGLLSRRAVVRDIGTAAGGIGFTPDVFPQQNAARPDITSASTNVTELARNAAIDAIVENMKMRLHEGQNTLEFAARRRGIDHRRRCASPL